jgi:glycosyltransferase involved in cell wall biosynthesis
VKTTVIVPAFNEEENLPFVLPLIPDLPEIDEVLLVDGHSADKTIEVARKILPRIKVISQDGSGKGDAIVCGARAATGDCFLILDADGSQMPGEIPLYIERAKAGFDLVKGSRYMKGGSSEEATWDRMLITRTAQFVANTLWRTKYTDICYGMFLIDRNKFFKLDIQSQRHDVEWEIMIKATRQKLKIVEVPAHEAKRISGVSHVSYTRDGYLIARAVFRESFRRLKGKE